MRRRAQIGLITAAIAVAAAGCGEKDEPEAGSGPETTTAPATTTTPPPATTTVPPKQQPQP